MALTVTGMLVATATVLQDPVGALMQAAEIGGEPGSTETTPLVTSNAEVRRSVVGLLVVAGLALVTFVVYWFLTGRAARARFASEQGGRHAVTPARRRARWARGPAPEVLEDAAVAPVRAADTAPASTPPPSPSRVVPSTATDEDLGRPAHAVAGPARARRARPEITVAPGQVHPGWLDPTGERLEPATMHPAWADQVEPARPAAAIADERRPLAAGDAPSWPRPFDGR